MFQNSSDKLLAGAVFKMYVYQQVLLLVLKIPLYLTFLRAGYFWEEVTITHDIHCTGQKSYIRNGDILILNNKAFLDDVHLPEIFTLESNLCLKVYDGNFGDMLT